MTASNVTYREYMPTAGLKDLIKSYWFLKIKTSTIQPFEIVPDGYFDLVISMKGQRITDIKITGIWSKKVMVCYEEDVELFGIRFKPLALGAVLHFDIKDLRDRSSSFGLSEIKLNGQQILDGYFTFPELLVSFLDDHFMNILSKTTVDQRLKRLFELVDLTSGTESVARISKKLGLSARQLHRNVSGLMGIGLKEYSKIIRFRKTLQRLKNNRSDYDLYFDQSHFIRDFKNFTGFSPGLIDLGCDVRFVQYYDFPAS